MPTVFSHPAPVLALTMALGSCVVPARLLFFGVLCAVLPDADVVGFRLGIPYAHMLGHRGIFHSLAFALGIGLVGMGLAPVLRCGRLAALGVGFFAVAGHILLDAMTSGGLGVAAFWPVEQARLFFPWRPIRVSPFGLRAFLSQRGVDVLLSELRWVWLPCVVAGMTAWIGRRVGGSSPLAWGGLRHGPADGKRARR